MTTLIHQKVSKLYYSALERFYLPDLRPEFKHLKFGSYCMQKLLDDHQFDSVLDVGSGAGAHTNLFSDYGKSVTALDYGKAKPFQKNESRVQVVITNFEDYQTDTKFDCVWCSHILEHQLNCHSFLTKACFLLKEGGVFAVTVPPLKSAIVGGHLSFWNAGLLLYHLIMAGFDCSNASVLQYGYNISVIVKKKTLVLPDLCFGGGDILLLEKYFPLPVKEGFEGNIRKLNW